jgi:uncharacterized protein YbaR (Trm112 family)/SAM-dependent methyltransferase
VLSFVMDMLQCPSCRGALSWRVAERRGERILEAEARCAACAAIYPVREGIGLFLTPDLPRDDLWEEVESGLIQYLRQNPDVERQLMDVPVETLAPADQFFRALVLEERGQYVQAKAVADLARPQLYTPAYLTCFAAQRQYIITHLARQPGPIVDLASGRGELVEALVRALDRPIIATDFSPRVLRRDRRWLEVFGLYERVSLLAFDARRTPFKDGAVTTMTTNLGLPNISQPDQALRELRRAVAGTFLALSHFFPEDDTANAAAIHAAGQDATLFRKPALALFAACGWQVALTDLCVGPAQPTPRGVVIEGAGIDGMPVAPTTLEWGVLVAH